MSGKMAMPTIPLLLRIWVSLQRRYARWRAGGPCHCICCGSQSPYFLPFHSPRKGFFEANKRLGIIGSDLTRYACAKCGASDRERHLQLYMLELGMAASFRSARILHFAPEPKLRQFVAACGPSQHVLADLYPAREDISKVDMLQMDFPDASFDVVIANHVLEHVANDAKALAEIRRVLVPGGLTILQTPYSGLRDRTVEDATLVDPDARQAHFGQDDHIRLYGLDIFDRIEQAGFLRRITSHASALSPFDPGVYGVNPLEPLMLFERDRA
jgi:SAM-dependent methyltransferase